MNRIHTACSRFLAFILSTFLCLPLLGCAQAETSASPVSYDAAALTHAVAGQTYANLFEYSSSPNGNYLIYIASQINQDPAVWLYDRKTDSRLCLTDNDYTLRSQARVDDGGTWALVQGFDGQEIICDGESIVNSQTIKRSLCFWRGKLFYAAWDRNAGTTGLFLYDPQTKETSTLASGLPLSTGLSAAAGDAVLLEAYDAAADANTVLAVYPEREGEESTRVLSEGNSFLIFSNGEPQVLRAEGDGNAKYYFNACYWLNRYQSGEPWSGSPDSAGRVSWNESYRLLGLLELWEKTGNETFRAAISSAVRRLISTREAAYQASGQERDRFLFVTRKYSLDQRTELRLLVNNAMVYYPMLRSAALGCLEEKDRRAVLSMAEAAFQYYEQDWDPSSGCYRFRKGEAFWADGAVLPFNQQNAFGLCLIEMYRATGKPIYRDRCAALARTFAKEIELAEDGRTIWHYWPQEFYDGWVEADSVSQNTPTRDPVEDPPYEDSSHASLNAAFILEYYRFFGDIFSPAQVQGLRLTLDAICTDAGLSTVLDPVDTAGWFLSPLWAKLASGGERGTALAHHFLPADTFIHAEYDSQIPLASARLYDPAEGGTLRVSTARFTEDSLQTLEVMTVRVERIPALAARFRLVPMA